MHSIKDNYVEWNGKMSKDYGIIVKKNPTITRPQQKYEVYSIAGKNGDIYMMQDAYSNYVQSYELFVGTGSENSVPNSYTQVSEWLRASSESPTINDYINLTTHGYHWLIDSYDPDCIRVATLAQGVQISNHRGLFGDTTVTFSCRPERFTHDSFTPVIIQEMEEPIEITNPFAYNAKPFIKVYGNGAGTLTVNGYEIIFYDIVDYVHVDCDSQNCFRQLIENRNNTVSLTNGFPVLSPESNTIESSGDITGIEITPRWWSL